MKIQNLGFLLIVLISFSITACSDNNGDNEPAVDVSGTYTGLFELGAQGAFLNFEDTDAVISGDGADIEITIDYLQGFGAAFKFSATQQSGMEYDVPTFNYEGQSFSGTLSVSDSDELTIRLKDENDSSGYAEFDGVLK